jgi:hypothetical protein
VEIALGQEWKINPTGIILERLSRLAGDDHVRLIYAENQEVGKPKALSL